jgi:uncharacterized protein YjiS (DUF1127 family)
MIGRRLAFLAERLIDSYRGWRDRQFLAGLDDRQLRDIGIDRATLPRDDATPFWRLREPGGTGRR